MKTRYEVLQELDRLERLVPHIISDQGERAEEILGFHIANLIGSAAPAEHPLIHARTAPMVLRCRMPQKQPVATSRTPTPVVVQPRWT
ncbi:MULTISPECIES: hypothetical protein [Gammaproteobacteria]|jgi:hypothetical protein|uniref:Uncharacterized protein n=1 Tax=Xanthomonas boreopolis TaxID=86183 RepID=A0A919F4I2_9XANT|nr:hypothetical protein [Pseudomonas sp. Hp2]GHH46681.1 hypothetical protein GCM10009090_02130 [[Pseudomonas] boreopolis]